MQEDARLLPQEKLIDAVRERSEGDARVLATLMYGSFAKGEGDRFSDVEFYVFLREEDCESLDRLDWVAAVAPVLAFFENEFGTSVAIFENLVRGEFHFQPHRTVDQVRSWLPVEAIGVATDMVILDRTGQLTETVDGICRARLTAENIQALYDRLLNWFLLGCNVLLRGERARALDALGHVHRFLLQLSRARAGAFEHWLTPSRNIEHELPAADYQVFESCTGSLAPGSLEAAYRSTWRWSQELAADLARSSGIDERRALAREIARRFAGAV